MKDFFNKCKPLLESFKKTKNIELEMRLGKINGNMFDTNVGQEFFYKILKGLKMYKQWEKITESDTSAYYKGSTRMTIDNITEDSVVIEKRKLKNINHIIADKPLDVRFSVSTETPCELQEDEVMDSVRHKKRISFLRKNLSIDMTIVTGDPDDLDDETETAYEIELEIVNPKIINDSDTFYNIVHKVNCVMDILEY